MRTLDSKQALGRVLIYGASRDTAALCTTLCAGGADVDFVHPTSVADALGTEFPAVIGRLRVGEPGEVTGHPFDYDAVFVDTSYDEILPPTRLSCSVEAQRAGVVVSCVADYVLARSEALTIAVTGSAGKTTTASLIAHILGTAGRWSSSPGEKRPSRTRCYTARRLEHLSETMARKTRTVVLYGEGGRILRNVLLGRHADIELVEVADLSAATPVAVAQARAGTALLFAPLFYVPLEERSQMGERLLRELTLLAH